MKYIVLQVFCNDTKQIFQRDHILHCSSFELASLCSCREVTGIGPEPQSSVSLPGTADVADRSALP